MSDHGNLYLLLVAEILMIVHFARHKGVSPGVDSILQQEVARTAT